MVIIGGILTGLWHPGKYVAYHAVTGIWFCILDYAFILDSDYVEF